MENYPPRSEVQKWSYTEVADHVAAFLSTNEYRWQFIEQQVDGDLLLDLNRDDCRDLGMKRLRDLKTVLNWVAKYSYPSSYEVVENKAMVSHDLPDTDSKLKEFVNMAPALENIVQPKIHAKLEELGNLSPAVEKVVVSHAVPDMKKNVKECSTAFPTLNTTLEEASKFPILGGNYVEHGSPTGNGDAPHTVQIIKPEGLEKFSLLDADHHVEGDSHGAKWINLTDTYDAPDFEGGATNYDGEALFSYDRVFKCRPHGVPFSPANLYGKRYLKRFYPDAYLSFNKNLIAVRKWFHDCNNPAIVQFYRTNFRRDKEAQISVQEFIREREPLLAPLKFPRPGCKVTMLRWKVEDIYQWFLTNKHYSNSKRRDTPLAKTCERRDNQRKRNLSELEKDSDSEESENEDQNRKRPKGECIGRPTDQMMETKVHFPGGTSKILGEVSLDKLTSDLTAEKKTSISKISRIFLKNQSRLFKYNNCVTISCEEFVAVCTAAIYVTSELLYCAEDEDSLPGPLLHIVT